MFSLFKDAALRWYEKDADHLSAALAYYTPFALTPLIFMSVTILSYFYGASYTGEILRAWGSMLGPDVLALLSEALLNMRSATAAAPIPVVGTLFFFGMIIVAFNTVTGGLHQLWDVPHTGWRGWLRKSWRSVVFVFVLQAYLVLIMGVDGFLHSWAAPAYVALGATVIAFFATSWLFYLMYRFLPLQPYSRAASLFGAAVASFLLSIAKGLIAIYVSTAAAPQLYEAGGLVVALLIWMYATAAVVYFGAAVVYEYDVRERQRIAEAARAAVSDFGSV